MFSGTLLPPLSIAAETSPLFPNEEALLGSLMRRAGVKPKDNTKFLPLVFCRHPDKAHQENVCGISKQIVVHGVKEKLQIQMHFSNALLNHQSLFCSSLQSSYNYEEMRNDCEL